MDEQGEETGVEPRPAPVGERGRVIGEYECLARIAEEEGFFWETLWTSDDNAALREARRDPYVLQPGDRVVIPALRPREVSAAVDQRHRFRRRGVPEKLVLSFSSDDEDEVSADVPYRLEVSGLVLEGSTDGDGKLEEWIPLRAKTARLVFNPDDPEERVYDLQFGRLAPVDGQEGLADRLVALGYGVQGADVFALLEAFQAAHDLPITGELDESTREQLTQRYGC